MTVPIEEVQIGDLVVVRPGQNIPVDGIITEGQAALDEAALTGESIPVEKGVGDTVIAATINKNGFITFRASRVGDKTTLSQIIRKPAHLRLRLPNWLIVLPVSLSPSF